MRTLRLVVVLASATFALGAPSAAEAGDPPARYALEVGAFGGYDVLLKGSSSPASEIWSRGGGGALAGSLSFRTPYVTPFVDVGYYPLYASQARVDLGSRIGTVVSTGTLTTIGVLGGLGVDLWRLRLRVGIGLHDLHVRSTVLGQTISPRESDMGYLVGLRGTLLRGSRLEIGAEARAGFILEADTIVASLGLTLGGDALTF